MGGEGKKRPWQSRAAGACGSFTRPGLVIPCRVARQQSPTPFRQAEAVYAMGKKKGASCGIFGKDGFAEEPVSRSHHRMQLKTILNRVEHFKSFVYGKAMGGGRQAAEDRSGDRSPQEWAADLLRLRSAWAGLRPAACAAFRVCSAVGDRGVLRLRHAAGGVSDVRREGGAGSLVRRQDH